MSDQISTHYTREHYINHEVRIRILESIAKDTRNLLRWLLGTAITAVLLPVVLYYLKLT